MNANLVIIICHLTLNKCVISHNRHDEYKRKRTMNLFNYSYLDSFSYEFSFNSNHKLFTINQRQPCLAATCLLHTMKKHFQSLKIALPRSEVLLQQHNLVRGSVLEFAVLSSLL